MTTDNPAVLFLCVHNAGRSQMAAGVLRHAAGDRISVYSAGSEPADTLNPAVVEAMEEIGIDITDQVPTKLTDDMVRAVDVVVTMGCGDACPIYQGKRYIDWELQDPAGQPLAVVRTIRDDVAARVNRLVEELLDDSANDRDRDIGARVPRSAR
jgi:arsenate reductase